MRCIVMVSLVVGLHAWVAGLGGEVCVCVCIATCTAIRQQ